MNIALDVSSVTMPSAFAELAAGVCWKPEEMIAMLWAYFDESGDHKQAGTLTRLTIGGLIASADAWKAFDDEWTWALAAKNRRHFHRRDFQVEEVDTFVRIICRHVGHAVSFSAAGANTYDTYEKGLVDCLVQAANISAGERVSLVFAKHPEFKPVHIQRYYEIVNYGSAQLRGLAFDDPKEVQPLQAADLIAHSLRNDVETQRLRELGCRVSRFMDGRPI
jgi:hypothetical protein